MASEKITNIIEEVKAMSVLELKELVDAIQEEFGVTAAAPVAINDFFINFLLPHKLRKLNVIYVKYDL